ncbi:glycosyl hydrolase family 28 protein [Synoicihabitans lomoniglobus]|uniref:Glycosyl hydrolase family 28 protein n=2 Tax=Synoicihabitans lomoniglobus TaxID=2909285 RepID=A0AAE9ZW77_9BACT|nr:glycosyl hydrolase family 28 protein [Opitutaceae bacterium LMO-M01]
MVTLLAGLAWPVAARDFVVTTFGAVGDGATLNTSAIQTTIDAAAAHDGGGRVVIPAGTFRSGSLFLRPDVELHLAADAVLLGSDNIADYPKRNTRIEGHFEPWRLALINATRMDGVKLTGPGRLDGNGRVFWETFWQRRRENSRLTNLDVERPRLVFIDRCTNVEVRELTFQDSGFWNLHLYNCRDVLVEKVSFSAPGREAAVSAPSSDGIDVDSCQDVIIRGCTFAVNDDCIALKGSKGPLADHDADSPPVENILVEDCTFLKGHGVLTCGSEATVVRNVTVRNCTVRGNINLVRLKLRPDTPQHYADLTYENIILAGEGRLFDINPWRQFFDLQGQPPPRRRVSGIVLRNISGNYGTPGRIVGNDGDAIAPIVLDNVHLTFTRPAFERAANVRFDVRDATFNDQPVTP